MIRLPSNPRREDGLEGFLQVLQDGVCRLVGSTAGAVQDRSPSFPNAGTWAARAIRVLVLVVLGILGLGGLKTMGVAWGRMRLTDAAEVAALQSMGRSDEEISDAMLRRAFLLGFHDVMATPRAVRVDRGSSPEAGTCAVEVDFLHHPGFLGFEGPAVRIHIRAELAPLPKPSFRRLDDLFP